MNFKLSQNVAKDDLHRIECVAISNTNPSSRREGNVSVWMNLRKAFGFEALRPELVCIFSPQCRVSLYVNDPYYDVGTFWKCVLVCNESYLGKILSQVFVQTIKNQIRRELSADNWSNWEQSQRLSNDHVEIFQLANVVFVNFFIFVVENRLEFFIHFFLNILVHC